MLTPLQPLHLSGPLHQPRNLLFRWRRGDPAPRSLGSVVYLWRKASTNGNLNHSGCRHRSALTYGAATPPSPKASMSLALAQDEVEVVMASQ
jgi:hypothetical protein